jgi:DNA-binding NarL/FixJ family response regulator
VSTVRPAARVLEAGTLARAATLAAETGDLDLILLDLKMPGASGYAGVALIHAERPLVPILVVSSADAAQALPEVRRFGAIGFLSKGADLSAIERAIAAALDGVVAPLPGADDAPADPIDDVAARVASLTPTQLKVLLGVLDGRYNKEIAFDLGISEPTVRAHMTAVLRKLDVTSRTQAALAARALGLGAGPALTR